MGDTKKICRTPTPGRKPTRIDRWKYDLVRDAIRQLVPDTVQGMEFRYLPAMIEKRLSRADKARLGSIPWYTTTVKLEMEVAGELERVPRAKPQRLRLVR